MDDLMVFKIVRLPKIRVIGRELRYSDEALNSGDNRLPAFWDQCEKEDLFAPLTAQGPFIFENAPAGVFLDWDLGDGDFSYIVGMLMKEGAAVPEGYFARDLPATEAAFCRVRCQAVTETRAVPFESTAAAVEKAGRSLAGMKWCADLYDPVRSKMPDENGYVTLDCYIPLD